MAQSPFSKFKLEPDSDKLLTLDFLRFVASVGIVYYHTNEFFYPPEMRATVIGGQGFGLFVDLFFVISGFVMGFVYLDRLHGLSDFARFMWRRIARLYPLHLVVLAINIGIWALLLTQAPEVEHPSFSPLCIAQTALLIQEYADCGNAYSFNGVTWSISVEMGLYCLFPIFVWMARRSVYALFGLGLALIFVTLIPQGIATDYGAVPGIMRGLIGFTFGIVLSYIRTSLPNLRDHGLSVLLALLLLIVLMQWPTSSLVRMGVVFLLATLAVASDTHGNLNALVRRVAPLGQLTYAIYIWHRVIILVLMNAVADKILHGNLPALVGLSVLTCMTILGVSWLGYVWIEVPARRALGRWVRAKTPAPTAKEP